MLYIFYIVYKIYLNFHTVKYKDIKYTIQWVWISKLTKCTILSPRKLLMPTASWSSPPVGNHVLIFVPQICPYLNFIQMEPYSMSSFGPGFFYCNILEIYSCCCTYLHIIFYCRIFHCINIQKFVYPVWW